jgi:chromosome segregation ATPase
MKDYQLQVEGLQRQAGDRQQVLEALDNLALSSKRDIDDLKRDNAALKLKLSKAMNQAEEANSESLAVKAKYERMISDKEATHEREKKILQKLVRELEKELKTQKQQPSPPKKPAFVNETFSRS